MSSIDEICQLIILALLTDGAHHKQWYLEQMADVLGIQMEVEYKPGVAP